MTDLARLYQSGAVRRYHHNPAMAHLGQTNADHQGRCVQLLLALFPEAGGKLIRAVAFHDVGELVAGDLGRPFKQAAPDLAAAHAAVEASARDLITGTSPQLTAVEARWLKLIDSLEAFCFALTHAPQEYARAESGWLRAEAFLCAEADALRVGPRVRGLLHDLKGGLW
jgi:5'-deoxynucleotidase YfbR-like HD superfamily hydrolase